MYSKDKSFSAPESGDYSVANSVVQYKNKTEDMQLINEKLHLSPGCFTSTFAREREKIV